MLISHMLCMRLLENMSWMDSIWLTLTTATTVGFGDHAPKTTEGKVATIILIYLGGIVMAARIGGLYFDYLLERRMKILNGKWQWKMKGHLIFINAPIQGSEEYFRIAVTDLRQSDEDISNIPIVIYSDQFKDGLPESVRKLEVAHVHAETITSTLLSKASVLDAAIIVILAKDSYSNASDSIAFDTIHRLRSMGVKARIITEAVNQENKQRMLAAGASNVIRPIRSYPELLVRSIVSPGSEQVIEELISYSGATCTKYEVAIEAKWEELRSFLAKSDLGVLIGYVDNDGIQHISPPLSDIKIDMHGLIVVVTHSQISTSEKIKQLIHNWLSTKS
ncbi:potassium channel family protein [Rickettsiales bacterium]|nr:potassium channel family protein [Rickettsiales bacterium]